MDGQQPPWLCSSTANFHFEMDGGTKVTPSPFFVIAKPSLKLSENQQSSLLSYIKFTSLANP
ncbi:hypothetical protein ACLK4E_05645 [Leptospira borgpetersenii]|uniref:Uncharacterized protein n=1 Tax=Leptospira borgpetersenii serovar Ballum TaxID=280505 RepID=A0A0E3B4Q6_LEPBO|nr:hypothetical protein [Leptospira borgpetersenii]APY24978.1 Uncharacterized protein LB4E_1824 [Leptospira borgpetersenii str. 4E]ALO26548.1 hypothetical protein LBBP_02298 [Leptospira borgpetersenii serovar Ballum]KGE25409.1 hypothetical protein IQ66_05025 [Leptospira borgpetersenii serovar Ballum]OOV44403.1 hypothetical protein B1H38_09165 [Leptospira borgpetersenii serovar Ballum]QHE27462.1 hypothetical protein GS524_11090 [Leptospira borgpetersenii]